MEYTRHYDSPLGGIMLASDGEALTGLWFDGQKYFAATLEREHQEGEDEALAQGMRWLDVYFRGAEPSFTPPFRLKGTAFQHRVWEILLTIPRGSVTTYGQIAALLAKERNPSHMSAQAVGGAVGHNPLTIIVPCHRVVGSDGSLTGYAGGIARKVELLKLEDAPMDRLHVPKRGSALGTKVPA